MKKIMIAALAVTTTIAVESSAAPQGDEAVKQTFAQLDGCIAKSDPKCIGELFVETATFSEPRGGAKIIKGKAQIVKSLEELMGGATPNMKGVKQTHTVENVRMIGDDHAVVDSSVATAGVKPAPGGAADAPSGSYHAVGIMVLKGDKWLFEDLRSYAVGPAHSPSTQSGPAPKDESAPAAKTESAPAPKTEPTQPEK